MSIQSIPPLADALERKVWGTLTINFRDGIVTHTSLKETLRPSDAPLLSTELNQHPAVNKAIANNQDVQLIFARVRGRLSLIAVERYWTPVL